MTSLVTQADGKESACMQETWIQSLGWEDPLEEGMAPHSSILAWRIPWTEKPGELQSMGSQSDTTERLTLTYILKTLLDDLILSTWELTIK